MPDPAAPNHPVDLEALAAGAFFIVGAPRSGTTLVQSVLAAHPRLAIPPETEFFFKHAPALERVRSDAEWRRWLDGYRASKGWVDQDLEWDDFQTAAEASDRSPAAVFLALMSLHAMRTGAPRIGEKSPHHVRVVDAIRRALPQAKFIGVIRDPRDVVASQLETPWNRGGAGERARAWGKLWRMQQRWRRELPPEVYTDVRYERLVEDLDVESRRLCAFLGEPFDEAMTRFHQRRDAGFAQREQAWKGATLRPVSQESVGSFRRRLTPRQIHDVERAVGAETLRALDLTPEAPGARWWWGLANAGAAMARAPRRWGRSVSKRIGRSGGTVGGPVA